MSDRGITDFVRRDNLIQHLKSTFARDFSFLQSDKMWIQAFKIYNKYHEKPLPMSCRPCYIKVIQFFQEQNKMIGAHGLETTKTK